MNKVACVLVLACLPAVQVRAQQAPPKIDVTRLGPQVGQRAPDFRLQDQQGKEWTRDSVMGPNGALLVFSRSADWCPYCKTLMIDLQNRLPELKAQGLGLAAITYDSTAVLADFSKRREIAFPLLSDPGSSTIKSYGILNTTVEENSSSYGIPFPGTLVIDREGLVTARFFEEGYRERTTVSSILLDLGGEGDTTANRITTDHLEITTYASDEVVAPGHLFSIVFDVELRARMHVYAPGAKGYRIISFNLEPNPLLVTRSMQYPPSEIYFFEPLNERVPVFQKPFRLMQKMAVSTSREIRAALAETGSVTIKGTLDYQACDDRICFNPKSIPVSYTVKLRPLDTERANVSK